MNVSMRSVVGLLVDILDELFYEFRGIESLKDSRTNLDALSGRLAVISKLLEGATDE